MAVVYGQPDYKKLSKAEQKKVDIAVSHGVPRYYATCILVSTNRYKHISFALGLAIGQQESGYRNVFGHDPTRSLPASWMGTKVTKLKYVFYRRRRKRGLGMQGVGPAQLTWWETQDYADERGGCHKAYVNLDVALQTLAARIRDFGYADGIRRYNGAGPAATTYSSEVRAKAAWWKSRLQ